MKRLPRITGKEIIAILTKVGFEVYKQRGSHVYLKHSDGRATTVPIHAGEIIGPGLLLKILKDVEMSRQDFIRISEK
jgi:predicted RNA binding protein YcfA (HicA-like mRNA interferase family)